MEVMVFCCPAIWSDSDMVRQRYGQTAIWSDSDGRVGWRFGDASIAAQALPIAFLGGRNVRIGWVRSRTGLSVKAHRVGLFVKVYSIFCSGESFPLAFLACLSDNAVLWVAIGASHQRGKVVLFGDACVMSNVVLSGLRCFLFCHFKCEMLRRSFPEPDTCALVSLSVR